MDFIDDVNLVFPFGRSDSSAFSKLANVIYASIGSGINFEDVGIKIFNFILKVIDFVGKNTGDGSFAATAWADEQVGVRNVFGLESFFEGADDLVFADDVGQTFWTIFTIQHLSHMNLL